MKQRENNFKDFMSTQKRDWNWWKISGWIFLVVFIFSVLSQPLAVLSFQSTNKDPIAIYLVLIAVIIHLVLMAFLPYLYFKKSRWAIWLTIIYLVIIEGSYHISSFLVKNYLAGVLIFLPVYLLYLFLALKTNQQRIAKKKE